MSSIRAEMSGDTDELLQRLNRLSHLETRGVLNSIAEGLRTSTVERFTEEKTPEGTSWKPSIRAQEEGGKTLTKTTQLKTSIRSEVSDSGLAVGTNDIRAATHQFGDERTIRAKNKKYLTFKIGGQWKRVASVKVSIPPRPFLGMLEERKGINNIYMQVVCSNSRYQRMDGRVQDINNAGIVTGLYGRAKESQSIGEVKSFPISEAKLLKLLPEGIEDYIETLDKAKYVTIRQYIGKEDYYVTSANMMSPEGSDYSYAEDVRVSNRLVKAVRAKALDELQVEVDPGDIETSITNIQEQLNTPVEDAVRDKVISSGSVTIDTENLNILVDEKLDINITYVPMGHVREMNLTFAVENPYAAS